MKASRELLAKLLREALLSTRHSKNLADALAQASILASIQGDPEMETVARDVLSPRSVCSACGRRHEG